MLGVDLNAISVTDGRQTMLRLTLLVLLVAHSHCMEMHETVERMVMVRTTGSDLQPEATGFIYKKDNDGEEKVVKLGETEVMEQLSKMYEQPKAFAAPIPVAAGPFYAKENEQNDGLNVPSNKDERVIPVKENINEVDGIADEDYGNIFKDYAAHRTFDDYMRDLKKFDHGLYNKNDNSNNDASRGYVNQYGKGGSGDYHAEKIQSFKDSKSDEDSDTHGNYADENKEARNRFRDFYVEDPYNKDFYSDEPIKNYFGKYANGKHESDAEYKDFYGDDVVPSQDYTKESDELENTSDEESYPGHGQFGAKIRGYSKSYGYQIEH